MLYVEERMYLLGILEDLIKYRLIDCTGGLLAIRCNNEHILMTTTGEAFRRWHIGIEDFIVTDYFGNIVEKHKYSSPAGTLIALDLFRNFPLCSAVLHTHSEYGHAFASLNQAVPQAAHLIQTLGEVPCIMVEDKKIKDDYLASPYPLDVPQSMLNRPDVVAVNLKVIEKVNDVLLGRKEELQKHGLAFLAYKHGIYVFAKSMDEAFENLARIESSARTYIYGGIIMMRQKIENNNE